MREAQGGARYVMRKTFEGKEEMEKEAEWLREELAKDEGEDGKV